MEDNLIVREGKNRPIYGFKVSDCPLWVYKGIAKGSSERYNDIYWMRIAELLLKEEFADTYLKLDKENIRKRVEEENEN